MTDLTPLRQFYQSHPGMVSSPFGGIEGYDYVLLEKIWRTVSIPTPQPGQSILEVGCGRAWLRPYFQQHGAKYLGVDLVRPDLLSKEGRGPDLLAEASHLPLAPKGWDGVLVIDAWEHFPAPDSAAKEIYRLLKPGGYLFVSAPNYANLAGLLKIWMERIGGYKQNTWAPFGHWEAQTHESFVTRSGLTKTFLSAGLKSVGTLGYDREIYLGIFPWAAHRLFPESLLFRLQRWCPKLLGGLLRYLPDLSLHQFRSFRKPQ